MTSVKKKGKKKKKMKNNNSKFGVVKCNRFINRKVTKLLASHYSSISLFKIANRKGSKRYWRKWINHQKSDHHGHDMATTPTTTT
jgi:hypothetical protein